MTARSVSIRSTTPSRRLPATREEAAAAIERLALVRAAIAQHDAQLDADVAALTAACAAQTEHLAVEEQQLVDALFGFCESRRAELTSGGRSKTVTFPAGTVSWRRRPVSIEIDEPKLVLDELRRAGRTDLIRTAESVDKPALLKAGTLPFGLPGVRVVEGSEDFVVKTNL